MFLLDGPACLLAYGEFRSTTLSGMWAQLLPHLVRDLVPVLILYAVASFVTERPYCRVLGVALYINKGANPFQQKKQPESAKDAPVPG